MKPYPGWWTPSIWPSPAADEMPWASSAAASIRAFGMDRGPPLPLEDIPQAQLVLLVGGNMAETMPPIMQFFEENRNNGGQLIVVDPRSSPTADAAHLHLALTPGTDSALANGLLHILIRDGLIAADHIRERKEGFEQVRSLVAAFWPERVERITGVPEAQLVQAARMLGLAQSAMVLTGRGPSSSPTGSTMFCPLSTSPGPWVRWAGPTPAKAASPGRETARGEGNPAKRRTSSPGTG